MIQIVANISSNAGLGYHDGSLLFHIKDDLKRFRELTQGQICVMGRKTFESIVELNGRPLPNRVNVVLTRDESYKPKYGEFVFHGIEQIIKHHNTMTEKDKKVMVIGGGEIYREFLPYADTVHLTIVNKHAGDAEVYYPMGVQDELGFVPLNEEDHYSEDCESYYKFVTYTKDKSGS